MGAIECVKQCQGHSMAEALRHYIGQERQEISSVTQYRRQVLSILRIRLGDQFGPALRSGDEALVLWAIWNLPQEIVYLPVRNHFA